MQDSDLKLEIMLKSDSTYGDIEKVIGDLT